MLSMWQSQKCIFSSSGPYDSKKTNLIKKIITDHEDFFHFCQIMRVLHRNRRKLNIDITITGSLKMSIADHRNNQIQSFYSTYTVKPECMCPIFHISLDDKMHHMERFHCIFLLCQQILVRINFSYYLSLNSS